MAKIFESDIEKLVCELLEEQGYTYLSPEALESERQSLGDVLLLDRLKNAIDNINPKIPQEAKDQALRQIRNLPSQNLIDNNEAFHRLLIEGIEVEYMKDHSVKGDKVWLIDYDDISNNDFLVCNQFTVVEMQPSIKPLDSFRITRLVFPRFFNITASWGHLMALTLSLELYLRTSQGLLLGNPAMAQKRTRRQFHRLRHSSRGC